MDMEPAETLTMPSSDKAEVDPIENDKNVETADATEIGDIVNTIVERVASCKIDTSPSTILELSKSEDRLVSVDNSVNGVNKDSKEVRDEDLKESCATVKSELEKAENLTKGESEQKQDCDPVVDIDFRVVENLTEDEPEQKRQDCDPVVDIDFRVVEILKTISSYKSLALNKSAHSLLLKEDALIGQLVLFLGDDSAKVVSAAFEVVKILYHNRSNHVALKNSLHFLEALIVVSRSSNLSRKIREDARKIHDIVRSSKPPLSQSNISQNTNPVHQNHVAGGGGAYRQDDHHRSGLAPAKGNRSRNTDRETVISVNPEALHHAVRRQEITTAVVKIKGIISVTYNLSRKHCIIRAKPHVPPEVFGKTIANLGVECYLVRRNENKEEVLLKMEADLKLENSLSSLEQENVPSYLPDDDEEEDDNLNKNDMVARGDEEASTVTGKISNFLRKSFFW